ncbi:hypothetical protein [Bacilliculturomica massiliensis]|nr:hypothetical protein [Bacilliculturomica massiliensis]
MIRKKKKAGRVLLLLLLIAAAGLTGFEVISVLWEFFHIPAWIGS